MREAVTLDHLRALAETCTDDELPGLLARRRRSATRIGLSTPIKTPEQRERFHDALARVRAPPTPGGRSGSISSALVPARRSGGAARLVGTQPLGFATFSTPGRGPRP
jgi:hypothetical protein